MKRTDIIPTLESLWSNPLPTIAQTYKICWFNGKLQMISAACSIQPEIVFLIVHKSEIREGLTSKQWNALEAKIVSFLTQKGLL